jgi:hypothetical protein
MISDMYVIESPIPIYTPEEYVIKLFSFETDTFTIVNKITTKENYQEHFNSLVAILGDFDVTTENFTYTLFTKVKVVKKGYLFNTVTDKVLNKFSLSLLKVDTTLSQLWNDTVENENVETQTETKVTETNVTEQNTYTDTDTDYTDAYDTDDTDDTDDTETDAYNNYWERFSFFGTNSSPKLYTNHTWMNYDWTHTSDKFPLVPLNEQRVVVQENCQGNGCQLKVQENCQGNGCQLKVQENCQGNGCQLKVQENCQGYGDNPFVFDWSKPQQKPVKKMERVFHDIGVLNEEVKLKLALPNFGLKSSNTKFKLH